MGQDVPTDGLLGISLKSEIEKKNTHHSFKTVGFFKDKTRGTYSK